MQKLLTYAEVKAIFGWKCTSTVRRYVKSGDLVRVQFELEHVIAAHHRRIDRIKHKVDERRHEDAANLICAKSTAKLWISRSSAGTAGKAS